jgi:hypothetical protein
MPCAQKRQRNRRRADGAGGFFWIERDAATSRAARARFPCGTGMRPAPCWQLALDSGFDDSGTLFGEPRSRLSGNVLAYLARMSKADNYRRLANECAAMALTATDLKTRSLFLHMAEVWTKLAAEDEHQQQTQSQTDKE